MTPEGKVKAGIRRWLLEHEVWYCMPIGSQFGNSGVPDFICCHEGRFLAIEAKAPDEALRPTQELQRELIAEAGGLWFKIDRPDEQMADVARALGLKE